MTINVKPYMGCNLSCRYCNPEDSVVVDENFMAKRLGDVKVGDKILGFDIETNRLRFVTVTGVHRHVDDVYRIYTSEGVTEATLGHLWRTSVGWRTTEEIMKSRDKFRNMIRYLYRGVERWEEDVNYRIGYILGLVEGGGSIGRWKDHRGYDEWSCRVALTDLDALEYLRECFLEVFGVETDIREFKTGVSGFAGKKPIYKVETRRKDVVKRVMELLEGELEEKYYRGYVAGIFDAEGSYSGVLRIANHDERVKARIASVLRYFEFGFVVEENGIRLLGGISEVMRFLATFRPKVMRRYPDVSSVSRYKRAVVEKVEYVGKKTVVHLETDSRTYIVDGFLCHNCYEAEYHGKGKVAPLLMKVDYDFDAILDSLRNIVSVLGKSMVVLHGGEVTVIGVDELERFFRAILDMGCVCGIQTNGLLLSDKHIELFKKYDVTVGVSLDGPDELNKARGWFGSGGRLDKSRLYTEKVEKYVRRMLEEGVRVGLIVVLNKYNAGDDGKLDRLISWCEEYFRLGLAGIRFNLAFVDGRLKDELELSEDRAEEVYLRLAEWALEHPNWGIYPFREFIDNLLGLGLSDCRFADCNPFRTMGEITIDPKGNVLNCNRLAGKDGRLWMRRDWNDGVNPRKLILEKTSYRHGGCRGCRYFTVCYGGCPAEAISGDWRMRTRFCKAYYSVYEFYERWLKKLMPNVILVPDVGDLSEEDKRERMNRQWSKFPFESMYAKYTARPSSFELGARKISLRYSDLDMVREVLMA